MIITHKLEFDLVRREVTPRLDAMQNDANTRSVEITLLENGSSWTIPDGVSVAVSYVKPDGTSGLYDQLPGGGNATDIGDNTIKFIMVPQMLTVPGLVRASVVLIKDAVQISTFPMYIDVMAQPGAGAEKSENYYHYTTFDALNNAIGNLNNLQTTDKSSLVAAINEVAKTGSSDSSQNGNGLTSTEKSLILSLFKNAAYTADMSTTIAQLETLWSGEDVPDLPEADVSQTGSILSIVSGVTASQSGSVLAIA